MLIRMKAGRLTDADVTHISLVERGANRSPFKITKADKESGMKLANLDLGGLFTRKSEAKTVVVGYVVQKDDNTDKIRKALGDAGIKVDAVQEFEDGTVLYKQDKDYVLKKEDPVLPVKLADDFIVLLKGFNPESMNDMSFAEVLKTEGFMPGFSMAADSVYNSVRGILMKAEANSAEQIEGALDEFNTYTLNMAKAIPALAFKGEEAFFAAKHFKVTKAAEGSAEEEGKETASEEAKEKAKEAKKKACEAMIAAGICKTEAEFDAMTSADGKNKKVTDPTTGVTSIPGSNDDGVAAFATAIQKSLEPVIAAVKQVAKDSKEQMETLSTRVEEVAGMVTKSDEKIKSLILGGEEGDDPILKKEKVQADQGRTIDTAFQPHVRKSGDALNGARRLNRR